jgi:hypothetical protein
LLDAAKEQRMHYREPEKVGIKLARERWIRRNRWKSKYYKEVIS